MEQSTLHIKAPHEIHIAAKVLAAQRSISMNQYVVDLIKADMTGNAMEPAEVITGIELARKATPEQKKTLHAASQVVDDIVHPVPIHVRTLYKLCKVHDTPLDGRGKCLQKGCKYG